MEAGSQPLTMRIVNAVFSKQRGGLEQASVDYAAAFSSLGHDVVMLLGHRAAFADDAREAAGKVQFQQNRFGKFDVLAYWQLRRWLQKTKPDMIVAHGNRAATLLRFAAKGIAPLVAVNHSRVIKAAIHADAVIAVNEQLKSALLTRGYARPDMAFVVPNMVTLTPEQRALRLSNAPQTPPVIGTLARFVPEKGLDVFLDALEILHRRGVAVRARIGGDGPERDNLKEQADGLGIADRVDFLGWVNDRAAFYAALDMYCLPSRAETFGIVVLEALQHKLPVVATNCNGVRQLADGRHVGLFVPVEDANALADAIERLLQDWTLAQRLAASGYALVEEKYDIQIVAGQLQNIIEQVAARYRSVNMNTQGAEA